MITETLRTCINSLNNASSNISKKQRARYVITLDKLCSYYPFKQIVEVCKLSDIKSLKIDNEGIILELDGETIHLLKTGVERG